MFLKVLHMQIAAQGKSVFDVAISVQLNVVSPFSWRERPSQENQLVAPFSNHQLPAKERVTSIPKVRTIIGGGPYQQLSPDQCLALGPFVRPNPTTSNQANFNLTYR